MDLAPPIPLKSLLRKQFSFTKTKAIVENPSPLSSVPALDLDLEGLSQIDIPARFEQHSTSRDLTEIEVLFRPDSPTRPYKDLAVSSHTLFDQMSHLESASPTECSVMRGTTILQRVLAIFRREKTVRTQEAGALDGLRGKARADASVTFQGPAQSPFDCAETRATPLELRTFLNSINSARQMYDLPHLVLDPFMCESAVRYVKEHEKENIPISHKVNLVFQLRHTKWPGEATIVQHTEISSGVDSPRTFNITRLTSSPCGALTCAERWVSGKYRKHTGKVDTRVHLQRCACREYDAWRVIMSPHHTEFGIAKDMHGQWIAEFLVNSERSKAVALAVLDHR